MNIQHAKFTEFNKLKNLTPSMVFNPQEDTLEGWQKKAAEKLTELLGLPYIKCEEKFTVDYEKQFDTYKEIRFIFQSEENEFVPCHLWLPNNAGSKKTPVMICLQGHSTGMHVSMDRPLPGEDTKTSKEGDRDFAVQCISHKIAAISLEQRCFGERGGNPKPDCHTASMSALLSGRTIIGGRVWDVMRLIDVIEKEFSETLDTEKIYCMGNSGGGTATFYATALEKRIKAAIPSCAFATFYGSIGSMYHCVCNFIPGIGKYFDMAEIAALAAPRPLVIVSGKEDGIFPLDTAEHEFYRLKEIYYKNSESPENCVHIKGDGGHRFYAAPAWKAFLDMV